MLIVTPKKLNDIIGVVPDLDRAYFVRIGEYDIETSDKLANLRLSELDYFVNGGFTMIYEEETA